MKVFTAAALISMLSVGMAREVYFEHPGALKTIAKREIHAISKRQAQNLATFSGALGGIKPTPIECSGDATRQFQVKADTFVNFAAAAQRSCDQQQNACSNAANAGGTDFSVADCQTQQQQCNSEQAASAGSCSAGAASGAASTGNTGAAAAGTASNGTAAASSSKCKSAAAAASTGNAAASAAANETAIATPAAASNANATVNCSSAKRRRNIHGMVKA